MKKVFEVENAYGGFHRDDGLPESKEPKKEIRNKYPQGDYKRINDYFADID
ncbi:hypothetical protein SK128_011877 [Halocaridina rubra]|uniref:Uncharacterized protein n=1 Tax=Halocaridina rubra TaxID=373956 RepID=A0AAN8X650_HALRR